MLLSFHEIDVFCRLSQSLKWMVNAWSVRMSKKKWMLNSFWRAQNKSRTIRVRGPKSIYIQTIHELNSFFMCIYKPRMTFFCLTCQHRLKLLIFMSQLIRSTNCENIYLERLSPLCNLLLFEKVMKLEMSIVVVSKPRLCVNGVELSRNRCVL